MGEAKRRGTREERVEQAEAAAREAREKREAHNREAVRLAAERKAEERKRAQERGAVIVDESPLPRRRPHAHGLLLGRLALMSALGAVALATAHEPPAAEDPIKRMRRGMGLPDGS